MNRLIATVTLMLVFIAPAQAQKKEQERLKNCESMLKEILDMPDSIPEDLLGRAECAIIFPSVLKRHHNRDGSRRICDWQKIVRESRRGRKQWNSRRSLDSNRLGAGRSSPAYLVGNR